MGESDSRHHESESTADIDEEKNTTSDQVVFRLRGVEKSWAGEHGFTLKVPELDISKGEKIALVGYSGSGKSTLLDMLAMILRPDRAESFDFSVDDSTVLDVMGAWQRRDLDRLARARMAHMGYVLQTGGLLPFLKVRSNIGLTCKVLGIPVDDAVEAVARRLDISRHLDKLPGMLSVGERQRVAIARAMAHEPSVVIADEPTASLDPINAEKIMALFARLADEFHVTLIVATHDWDRVAQLAFRRVEFGLKREEHEERVQVTVCA